MKTTTAVSYSTTSDSFQAGEEMSTKILSDIKIGKCDFALVFASCEHDAKELLKGVISVLGVKTMIIGGTTTGIITCDYLGYEGFLAGIEMSQKIKSNDKTKHIPIIMLTAKADKKSKFEGLEIGADDYIVKPFDMDELYFKIKNKLEVTKELGNKFRKDFLTISGNSNILSPDDCLLKSVIELMNKNINNAEFCVEDICKENFLSKAQLYRKIHSLTGLKPAELLRTIRLKTAAVMFQEGHANVAQVMYQVGFNNQSNFAKKFKKQFKINPSAFIKQQDARQLI